MDMFVYSGSLGSGRKITGEEAYKIAVENGMRVEYADENEYLPSPDFIKHNIVDPRN